MSYFLRICILRQLLLFNMDTFRTPLGIILYPKTTWYEE